MKLTRENAILPFTPAADLTGKEGYAVSLDAEGKLLLHAAEDAAPFGIIIHGTDTSEKTSVALLAGGLAGTVKLKLNDAVSTVGPLLRVTESGTFTPDSGYNIACAQALETGVAGELIEAVLFRPVTLS